jgi:hypothetical protein
MYRALVVALVVGGTVGSIGAQSITGWRTPSGKLYFGDSPPRGSRKISTTYTPPPMNTPPSNAPAPDDVASVPPLPRPSAPKPTGTEPIDRDIRGTWAGMTDAHQAAPQDLPPGWR